MTERTPARKAFLGSELKDVGDTKIALAILVAHPTDQATSCIPLDRLMLLQPAANEGSA